MWRAVDTLAVVLLAGVIALGIASHYTPISFSWMPRSGVWQNVAVAGQWVSIATVTNAGESDKAFAELIDKCGKLRHDQLEKWLTFGDRREMVDGDFDLPVSVRVQPSSSLWNMFVIALLVSFVPAMHVALRVLTKDERRLSGFCMKCGYDPTGNPTDICPECGSRIGSSAGDEDTESQQNPSAAESTTVAANVSHDDPEREREHDGSE